MVPHILKWVCVKREGRSVTRWCFSGSAISPAWPASPRQSPRQTDQRTTCPRSSGPSPTRRHLNQVLSDKGEKFQKNSEKFPKNSKKIPKNFQKISKKIPKKFQKNSTSIDSIDCLIDCFHVFKKYSLKFSIFSNDFNRFFFSNLWMEFPREKKRVKILTPLGSLRTDLKAPKNASIVPTETNFCSMKW